MEHPHQWPGVHCAHALIEGQRLEGTWFDRSAYWRAQRRRKASDPPVQESDFKTTETLELSPLPCLANLGATQQRDLIESTIDRIVAGAAAARGERGQMVVGAANLQRQHPHSQPNRRGVPAVPLTRCQLLDTCSPDPRIPSPDPRFDPSRSRPAERSGSPGAGFFRAGTVFLPCPPEPA